MIAAAPLPSSPADGLDRIAWRLVKLPVPVSRTDFFDHVNRELAKRELIYRPSYFATVVATKRIADRPVLVRSERLLHQMFFSLEMAAVCCIRAKNFPERAHEFLQDALVHFAVFDHVRHGQLYLKLATMEARRRGGQAAQRQRECARIRGARLIVTMRPPAGWKSPAQAAHAIRERLARFIRARRVPLVCEGSLQRTIVRWIHNHPAVQAAYAATCR